MTNYDYIKSISVEEMANLIQEIDDNKYVANTAYCYEVCTYRVNGSCSCEEGKEHCSYLSDKECIVAWLNHERTEV